MSTQARSRSINRSKGEVKTEEPRCVAARKRRRPKVWLMTSLLSAATVEAQYNDGRLGEVWRLLFCGTEAVWKRSCAGPGLTETGWTVAWGEARQTAGSGFSSDSRANVDGKEEVESEGNAALA
ncbi:hypothetical protein E4U58_005743 [Claviceps cyperi]|nr:hypothetical protein E4U58_005743 [Claviceps cyperi]